MRVLIGCESSGMVRDAFKEMGHLALSVDLTGTESRGLHVRANLLDILSEKWDLLIAFPPCTYLTRANNGWGKQYIYSPEFIREQEKALLFVAKIMDAPIKRIAIENPPGKISTFLGQPQQIIHPWQFGHPVEKSTCLWLKGLPELMPTEIMAQRIPWNRLAHTSRSRSRTFPGIAKAMAKQWG